MAISKFEKTNAEKQELDLTEEGKHLKSLYEKIDESLDKTNEHITKVASMQSEIDTEKNKTGITQSQADAIVANTKKTGISTTQANLITALNQGVQQAVSTTTKGVTATIIPRVVVGKTNALELSIRLSNGQVYATSLALTRIK